MLVDGKYKYDERKDSWYKIAESVEFFYPYMWEYLYNNLQEDGTLKINPDLSKEQILKKINQFLSLGLRLGHSTVPSKKMCQYFESEFSVECVVEFIHRRRRTFQWEPASHDYKYIEQDLPLASDEEVKEIAAKISEWGKTYAEDYKSELPGRAKK